MKTYQAIALILATFVATCAGFTSPSTSVKRPAFKASALMSKSSEKSTTEGNPNAAAIAALTTALAPFAANAADVDEGVIIGYGAGLVACVVSLAVGFAIGYGTLVKP